jgi:hypothetical protein
LEEEEKGNREEGARVEKEKRRGVFGQTAIFILSNRTKAGEGD